MINTSIVLADDHAVVRQGLLSLLRQELGYSVVGEAADGPSAIALVVQMAPDVLVLDIMMHPAHKSLPPRHLARPAYLPSWHASHSHRKWQYRCAW
jgi:DNA-binding NarL/FixJ family response regulator